VRAVLEETVSLRPRMHLDDRHRAHRARGPALPAEI